MSFALIGRMLANRIGTAPPKPTYPLSGNIAQIDRARLGGWLGFELAAATLITAEASGSFVKAPVGGCFVNGYGKIEDGDFVIHRFYLGDYFFQVVTQRPNLIVSGETKLFQKLAEITPSTPEEWDLWIKGIDGAQPLLTGPTIKWQDTEYTRVWSPGNGATEPKRYAENITVGDVQTIVSINAMLFSRTLSSGQTEWLQLAMCRTGAERWIEAYVGLSLEPGEISAI